MMSLLLRKYDYQVTTADGVASGLVTAKSETFDAYILDSRFLDGTGDELCRKIREFDPFTPIIFYTGYLFNGSRERALSSGAQDYILKPDIDALTKALDRTLHLVRSAKWRSEAFSSTFFLEPSGSIS